jgi:hypothetical protein
MRRLWVLLGFVSLLGGCATKPPEAPAVTANDQRFGIRNQGYSLLHKLLSDEKELSKLLVIKKENSDAGALIKEISQVAADAVKQLEAFSKADSHLHLNMPGLPQVEAQARDLISKTEAKELITKSGEKFEMRVLITQADALRYASALAAAISAHEGDQNRKKFLAATSEKFQELHQKLIDLMHTRWKMPEPAGR